MLKAFQTGSKSVKFLNDNSTYINNKVGFVVFDFKGFKKVVLDTTTSPTAKDFVDKDLNTLFTMTAQNLTSSLDADSKFNDGFYEVDYYISTKIDNPVTLRNNRIEVVGVLQNFKNTNLVHIHTNSPLRMVAYEIDIRRSTENSLYLLEPIKVNDEYINTTYTTNISSLTKYKCFFVVASHIKEEALSEITNLSFLDETERYNKVVKTVVKLVALDSAIDCNNYQSALEIYNHLKTCKQ
jgi:hypothetical protein